MSDTHHVTTRDYWRDRGAWDDRVFGDGDTLHVTRHGRPHVTVIATNRHEELLRAEHELAVLRETEAARREAVRELTEGLTQ